MNFLNKVSLLVLLFVTLTTSCLVEKPPMLDLFYGEKIGIRITKKRFEKLIEQSIIDLNDSTIVKNTAFYINFVRIVNTIGKNNWFDKYRNVLTLFNDKVMKDAMVVLRMGLYKGGASYSGYHNLFIGGKPHAHSQYQIIDR
jgi:hypothetical protein